MNMVHDKSKDNKKKGKGFYVALAICLTAVGAAGWTTYRSVQEFVNPPKEEISEHISNSPGFQEIEKSQSSVANKHEIIEKNSDDKNPRLNKSPANRNKSQTPRDGDPGKNIDDEELRSVSNDAADMLVIYPTDKTIIKEFSDGKPVYSKTLGDWRVHEGTDFKSPMGSVIKSVTSGLVKDIYDDPMYGMTIAIEHDLGFTAYYSGLGDTTLVNKGDTVKAGQDIGSINDVPIEVGEEPHLHFMVDKGGKFIDPILVLEKETQ